MNQPNGAAARLLSARRPHITPGHPRHAAFVSPDYINPSQVVCHMMPDLPNVGWERDIEAFREFFENPEFRWAGRV